MNIPVTSESLYDIYEADHVQPKSVSEPHKKRYSPRKKGTVKLVYKPSATNTEMRVSAENRKPKRRPRMLRNPILTASLIQRVSDRTRKRATPLQKWTVRKRKKRRIPPGNWTSVNENGILRTEVFFIRSNQED